MLQMQKLTGRTLLSLIVVSVVTSTIWSLGSAPSRTWSSNSNVKLSADLQIERSVGLIASQSCDDLALDYTVALFSGTRVSLEFAMTEDFSMVAWEASFVDRATGDSVVIDRSHQRGKLLEGLHALKTTIRNFECESCELRLSLLGGGQSRHDFCLPVSVVQRR